ncbi:hypothetical protein SprV_0100448500 [Sparganum proliferum]
MRPRAPPSQGEMANDVYRVQCSLCEVDYVVEMGKRLQTRMSTASLTKYHYGVNCDVDSMLSKQTPKDTRSKLSSKSHTPTRTLPAAAVKFEANKDESTPCLSAHADDNSKRISHSMFPRLHQSSGIKSTQSGVVSSSQYFSTPLYTSLKSEKGGILLKNMNLNRSLSPHTLVMLPDENDLKESPDYLIPTAFVLSEMDGYTHLKDSPTLPPPPPPLERAADSGVSPVLRSSEI